MREQWAMVGADSPLLLRGAIAGHHNQAAVWSGVLELDTNAFKATHGSRENLDHHLRPNG